MSPSSDKHMGDTNDYNPSPVSRMEDARLPKCVMFGEIVRGAGCLGGQEKNLRTFGINAGQWRTGAQDEGELRRTAVQGVVCPNVTEWTKIEDSPKQAGSCWFARPC